jgi:hypothetical protein
MVAGSMGSKAEVSKIFLLQVVAHEVTEGEQATVQVGLHRSLMDSEGEADVSLREIGQIAEDDGFALSSGQSTKCRHQSLAKSHGIGLVGRRHGGGRGQRLGQVTESFLGRHPQDPGIAPGERPYALPVQVGPGQSLHGGILGRGPFSGHPSGHSHGAGKDPAEEFVVVAAHHHLVKGVRAPIG